MVWPPERACGAYQKESPLSPSPRPRNWFLGSDRIGTWAVASIGGAEDPQWVDSGGSIALPRAAGIGASRPLAPSPGEGPLTEPIAGAQPQPQERVLMPLLRHSLRRAGRGILTFGSARSVWSNTPSRPLGSDRNDVAANCRDVEGNHRLGQAPQGERAELLGFDASFERRVDALAEQDFQVDAAGGGGAVGAVGVAVGSLVDPLPVPGLIAPWALPFRSRKSALRRATRRFTGRAAM